MKPDNCPVMEPCIARKERRREMKRRILCVLLALVLCAALLPMTVGAANEDVMSQK